MKCEVHVCHVPQLKHGGRGGGAAAYTWIICKIKDKIFITTGTKHKISAVFSMRGKASLTSNCRQLAVVSACGV
jgi:hypothetical protein